MTTRPTTDLLDAFADLVAERLAARVATASDYVSEEELIALLGSKEKILRMLKRGELSGAVVGRRVVVTKSALAELVERMRVRPTRKAAKPAPAATAPSLDEIVQRSGMRIVGGRRAAS